MIIKNLLNTCKYLIVFAVMVLIVSCNKKEEIAEINNQYSYEVNCQSCDIDYTDSQGETKRITNNYGKWILKLKNYISADLKINVIAKNSSYPHIEAYILKKDKKVSGSLGYHYFNLSYNIGSGRESIAYGSLTGSGGGGNTGGGAGNGGSSGGGSTSPVSSKCGARTQGGGSCQRVVSGGGRCWQHR